MRLNNRIDLSLNSGICYVCLRKIVNTIHEHEVFGVTSVEPTLFPLIYINAQPATAWSGQLGINHNLQKTVVRTLGGFNTEAMADKERRTQQADCNALMRGRQRHWDM